MLKRRHAAKVSHDSSGADEGHKKVKHKAKRKRGLSGHNDTYAGIKKAKVIRVRENAKDECVSPMTQTGVKSVPVQVELHSVDLLVCVERKYVFE